MVTIISTHPVTVRYIKYECDETSHSKRAVWDCTIKGGAGIALGKGELVVHDGLATEISDEAIDILNTLVSFQNDVNHGFIKVLKHTKARTVDPDEEAIKDMNTEGSGKQITSSELEKNGAVINDDGSIDVTKGGKDAVASRIQREQKKSVGTAAPTGRKRRGKK